METTRGKSGRRVCSFPGILKGQAISDWEWLENFQFVLIGSAYTLSVNCWGNLRRPPLDRKAQHQMYRNIYMHEWWLFFFVFYSALFCIWYLIFGIWYLSENLKQLYSSFFCTGCGQAPTMMAFVSNTDLLFTMGSNTQSTSKRKKNTLSNNICLDNNNRAQFHVSFVSSTLP